MKIAGETWQRSQQTSLAAGSYIQPCNTVNWNIEFKIVHLLSYHQSEFRTHSNLLHLVVSWSWRVMCGHEIKIVQIANVREIL